MILLVFFDFELKNCFRVPTLWGMYGVEWTSIYAVCALFSHFCYVGGCGHVGDPVLPTPRGVSGDVVTAYAYWDTKERFLQPVALPRAGQNPCQRRTTTVSNNNGPVNGPVHNLLMHFFILGQK